MHTLAKASDFAWVYQHGRQYKLTYSRIWVVISNQKTARLGLAVSRKFGHAVKRNKLKRWVRAVFRETILKTTGLMAIDIIYQPNLDFPPTTYHDVAHDFRCLLEQLAK